MSAICPFCGGFGWTLDCNDMHKQGPRHVELIECFYPDCDAVAEPIGRLVFKGPKFTEVSRHPGEGWVMSVGEWQ